MPTGIYEDITGRRYGRLHVLSRFKAGGIASSSSSYWSCRCDCGVVRNFRASRLKAGTTVSCGCFGIEKRILPNKGSITNKIWKSYIANAALKSIAFSLSREEFEILIFGRCFYCGIAPTAIKSCRATTGLKANGIDRVDNDLGYTKENCVTACADCNYAKRNRTVKEFLDWVARVSRFQISKGGDAKCHQ